jgi:hypothetical protein
MAVPLMFKQSEAYSIMSHDNCNRHLNQYRRQH